jgi:hypothetical protein
MDQPLTKLPARTGWLWLREGMTMFRRQPGPLTTLLFIGMLASVTLSALPLVGPFLAVLLVPAFSMAVLGGCALIDRNERILLPVFMTGLRKPVLPRMLKLGIIYLGLIIVLTIATHFLVDDAFMQQLSKQDPKNVPKLDGGSALGMLAVFALQVVGFCALAFAAPLIVWKDMPLGKAVFYSVVAVARAWKVFFVLFTSWFGFMLASSMFATALFGLVSMTLAQAAMLWVMLLFVLFMQCAIYVGYRELFGAPPSSSAQAGDP